MRKASGFQGEIRCSEKTVIGNTNISSIKRVTRKLYNAIYTWIFENRVSKNIYSFYYLAISNIKTRSKPLSDTGQYVNGP